jgi:hypothetical protein
LTQSRQLQYAQLDYVYALGRIRDSQCDQQHINYGTSGAVRAEADVVACGSTLLEHDFGAFRASLD